MPDTTNNQALNNFLDDDYQSRAYIRAQKIVHELRYSKKFKELNPHEFLVVRKTLAEHLNFIIKEDL